MKANFNIVLDTRDDGVKVWMAKCLRCDAVIVGESAGDVPVLKSLTYLAPAQVTAINKQARSAWLDAKKNGVPFVIPTPDFELVTLPDHGLQRALDAHVEACK